MGQKTRQDRICEWIARQGECSIDELVERLGVSGMTIRRDLSALAAAERARVNFDVPVALDHELLIEQVHALSRGETVERPLYDFATHTRLPRGERFAASEFLIIEGLFALYWPEVRALVGTKIFVDAPDDVCLSRRQRRDVAERGRTVESVLAQFNQTVQPMAALHIRPTFRYADLVLSGEQPLPRSVDAALKHVRRNSAAEVMLRRVVPTNPSRAVLISQATQPH